MATELIQPPIPPCYVVPATTKITKMMKNHRPFSTTHFLRIKSFGFRGDYSSSGFKPIYTIKVAERSSSGLVGEEATGDYNKVSQIKERLFQAIQGINRGIFGVPSAKKAEIEGLVELLESQNPNPNPTQDLEKVGGWWKLVYSTISILGSKRTKLGLRDIINLGDFIQIIDVAEDKAVNVIKFNVRGINMLNGQLTIEASFKIASKSRVDIKYENSTITPDQLMNVFRKNYDLLLGIFNPEGWLEISYVDESMRIGRDGKGNIFILQRSDSEQN